MIRDSTIAAYWVHWTEKHLSDTGANLDLVMGRWGDETSPADRFLIALVHQQQADGKPALMVIDASERSLANEGIAGHALGRADVIGTPLARQVFALIDAIYQQDQRFF